MTIIFDEEQQAHIDGLIKKKYAEAHAKAEAKAAEQVVAAEMKHAEETQTLRAELEKLKASQGESNERIRKALLQAEIAGAGAVNETQVAKLISDEIAIGDDGALKVVDEKGVARLDASGKPLSVKIYLEAFLKDNPHLRRSTGTTGSGSTGAIGFDGLVRAANTMRRGDFDGLSPQMKHNFLTTGGRLAD